MTENSLKRTEIHEWLLGKIKRRELLPGDRIPSEYELAEQFGVNKGTANKAVAELVGRNILRRGRGGAGTLVCDPADNPRRSVGLVITPGIVSYYQNLIFGIQNGVFGRGYDLKLFDASLTTSDVMFRKLLSSGICGVLCNRWWHTAENFPFPLLYVSNYPGIRSVGNTIVHDNFRGGRELADHLLRLGHTEIIYVTQDIHGNQMPLCDRYNGFTSRLADDKLEIAELFCYPAPLQRSSLKQLLQRHPHASAIACDGDNAALQTYILLREFGLRVPEDISLTGFSNLPEVQQVLKITTVDEQPLAFGMRAAGLLIDRIENPAPQPICEVVPMELKIGVTTSIANRLAKKTLP